MAAADEDEAVRTPDDQSEQDQRPRKQAVVVVHGIGEQRPLETLRSFVDTVYRRDPSLTRDTDFQRVDDPVLGRINRVWIVPDAAAGSAELRRISTPKDGNGQRTDFFEFYWADIMQGTPTELVVGWIRGLLLRSPARVPQRTPMWIAWLSLWVLAILFVAFALAIAEPDSGPFAWLVHQVTALLGFVRIPLAGLLIIAGLVLAADQTMRAFRARSVDPLRPALPLILLVIGIALGFFFAAITEPRAIAAILTAITGAVIAGVVVPYVGDIARYVRATPATIAKRKELRDRGLALLKAIHDKRDHRNQRVYDRVIVVAHSLGSIVAYDLINQLWEELGPNHKRKGRPDPAVVDALRDVDAYVAKVWCTPEAEAGPFALDDFQKAQHRVFKALADSDQGWLISDFITVGSPLVHAEFLLTDSRGDMARGFSERFLASAPPRPDEPRTSMLYGRGDIFAHFAAPFAAVRWTNIYDEHWFPLCGDIVSGPVASRDRFGPGIREHGVAIRRPGPLARFVTHTLYWTWRNGYNPENPPAHIVHLRTALDLARSKSARAVEKEEENDAAPRDPNS